MLVFLSLKVVLMVRAPLVGTSPCLLSTLAGLRLVTDEYYLLAIGREHVVITSQKLLTFMRSAWEFWNMDSISCKLKIIYRIHQQQATEWVMIF